MTRTILHIPDRQDGDLWRVNPAARMHAPHTHDELEVNLVTRGRARYLLGGRAYDLGPRSMTWLFPAQDHVLVDISAGFEMWIGVFREKLIRRCARGASYATLRESDPPGEFCKVIARADSEALETLATQTEGAHGDPARVNAGLAHLLLECWNVFSNTSDAAVGREVHPAVEKAARLLREGGAEMDTEELAGMAGLSRSQLSRLFHRQTGVTIARFRNRLRLDRFLAIYGQGQRINMLEAAYEAGFGSYAQFHRVFKAFMGFGPRAYGKSVR